MKDRPKLFDATVTPSLFYASGTLTTIERMKNKFQTAQRLMLRIIFAGEEEVTKSNAVAHAATKTTNPRTLTTKQKRTRLRSTSKTPHDQLENSHNVDSNTSPISSPQDDEATEDQPAPWVDFMLSATHKVDELMTASGITP